MVVDDGEGNIPDRVLWSSKFGWFGAPVNQIWLVADDGGELNIDGGMNEIIVLKATTVFKNNPLLIIYFYLNIKNICYKNFKDSCPWILSL